MDLTVRRILLVDDDPDDALIVRELLAESTRLRFELDWVPDFPQGVHAIAEDRHDAYLIDFHLGEQDGTELLRVAERLGVHGPVIMLTGQDSAATDEAARRLGASDYLVKGRIDTPLLERSIRYAIGRKQEALRQRFLSEASRVLSSSLDLEETLHAVTRLGVPLLGDYCLLYYAHADDGQSRLVGATADPSQADKLRIIEQTYRPDPNNSNSVIARVQRSGVSERIGEVPDAALVALARTPEQLEAFRSLAARAGMVVPLVARGESRGAIVFNRTSPGVVYTDEELALAEELARRAALTIDNADLYRRAQRATALRDDVLAVVSHDLRNPLSTIMMSVSFVLDVLPSDSVSDAVRQQLGVVKRATARMRRLIDDLLDVTRIEAGHLSLEVQLTTVEAVLKEFCESMELQTASARQRLVCDVPEGLPLIAVDRERLLQVLGNLVGNALKFAPAETPIVLTARPENDEVLMSVSDSGPGIEAENLTHLFERFWQKRKGARSGAGLGLAITKAIVEGHAGRIWVESVLGKGTTFHFTVPCPSLAPAADRAEGVSSAASTNATTGATSADPRGTATTSRSWPARPEDVPAFEAPR